jgi:hypothetical protein
MGALTRYRLCSWQHSQQRYSGARSLAAESGLSRLRFVRDQPSDGGVRARGWLPYRLCQRAGVGRCQNRLGFVASLPGAQLAWSEFARRLRFFFGE